MTSQTPSCLHFVLIPLVASGHQIPTVDIGKLLSQHGVTVTIVTTPLNALRLDPIITAHSADSGIEIQLLPIQFPSVEAGLPEGCENLDVLPSHNLSRNFFEAARMMREPIEKILWDSQPPLTCIISDKHLPWTVQITSKLRIPRILFDGTSCFNFVCSRNILTSKVMSGGRGCEEMRKRAIRLAEMAKRAIGGGGSSYLEIELFVEDVKQVSNKLRQEVKDL